VLERTELSPADPKPERMLRRGITQVPREGVRVTLQRRTQPAEAGAAATATH
jgi:hypothetical protein